jgi:hypothetical protein
MSGLGSGKSEAPWGSSVRYSVGEKYCPKCGSDLSRPMGQVKILLDDESGSDWTDIVGLGFRGPWLMLSEKAVKTFNQIDSSLEDIFPVIIEGGPTKLWKNTPPKYFLVSITVGIRLSPESRYEVKSKCDVCGCVRANPLVDTSIQRDIFMEESWNKRPIFKGDVSGNIIFCTEDVVRMSAREKLVGFRFVPCGPPIEKSFGYDGVPYLKDGWESQVVQYLRG